jgi:sialidase-1
MAVEMADGKVYLNMRARDMNTRSVAWSDDGGITWSTPIPDAGLPDPVCQASVLRAGDRVFFANPSGPGRANLLVRVNEDGAATWDVFRNVHDGPAAYSDLGFLPSTNELLCLFECGKERPYERIRFVRLNLSDQQG